MKTIILHLFHVVCVYFMEEEQGAPLTASLSMNSKLLQNFKFYTYLFYSTEPTGDKWFESVLLVKINMLEKGEQSFAIWLLFSAL